jgi:transcriptional regulator with XRE-family HTH domain
VEEFDLPGTLRRIRRTADLSQRQLAETCGVSQSLVARAEAGKGDVLVGLLGRMAALAGLRVALLDGTGTELRPMDGNAVRDGANRRFPAHLDTRYGDEDWWHGPERYSREQPWYTFDRARDVRDQWRTRLGIPDDHQLPQPGDSPEERRARRQAEERQRRREERERRWAAGELRLSVEWRCDCTPDCAERDVGQLPAHIPECPCECDVD